MEPVTSYMKLASIAIHLDRKTTSIEYTRFTSQVRNTKIEQKK
jgi:hypothetical protein